MEIFNVFQNDPGTTFTLVVLGVSIGIVALASFEVFLDRKRRQRVTKGVSLTKKTARSKSSKTPKVRQKK